MQFTISLNDEQDHVIHIDCVRQPTANKCHLNVNITCHCGQNICEPVPDGFWNLVLASVKEWFVQKNNFGGTHLDAQWTTSGHTCIELTHS